MSSNHWTHVAHAAAHSDSKLAPYVLIFVGFITLPVPIIGIPILILGFAKLFK